MSDIEAVIDRILRDYLQPPGEQPSRFVINDTGGISASDTSVVTSTALLSPEEEGLIGAGTLLEIESELVLVTAVSGTAPALTLTIRRGMYGTTAAIHADATEIVVAGEDHVPRKAIFDAVADAIEGTWPDLWTVDTELTSAALQPVELPATVGEVLDIQVLAGSRWRRQGTWEELQDFPLSATEKAIQISGVSLGSSVIVYYKKKATRPTAESDTLASLGVEAGWVKAIIPAAVAQLVANRDLNAATMDFITQSLEAEAGGAVTGADIRNALLQFQRVQLDSLKRAQPLMGHDRVIIDDLY